MKISELMNELEKLMWKEGDVDVYAVSGCGCCCGEVEPEPRFYEANEPDVAAGHFIHGPEGVYLN